jgi:hypothetical protein
MRRWMKNTLSPDPAAPMRAMLAMSERELDELLKESPP